MEEFFHIKGDISLSGNTFEAYSDITDDIYASCDIGSKCTFGWALVLESGMISGYESPVFIWYDDKELTHHDMFLWLYGITDAKWLDENGVKSPDDMFSALVDIGYGVTYRSGHGFIYNSGSDENIIKASYLYENAPIDNKYKSKILVRTGTFLRGRLNAMSKRRNKTAEITWGEAQEVLDGCVDMAVSNFEELVPDYDYVEDAVSDAIHDAYESTLMYSTDQLAMIWACGALDQALQNAWEAIDEVVYDEFYKRIDPDDYRKEGRRKARRKRTWR